MNETVLLAICLGVGLSAASGFRVFVPLLVLSLAVRAGWVAVAGDFSWVGEPLFLLAFAVASVLEIGAYYVPWLDNLLDAVATPAAVVAGTIATASVVTGMNPGLKWMLAIVAGGGIAALVQSSTVGLRQLSSLTTGGVGNPVVASAEGVASLSLSVLSVLVPLLAAIVVISMMYVGLRWMQRLRRRRAAW